MKTPYTLAISSFAVHGTASLKTFISILGQKILPVPSLLLNGLTNMGLVKKLDVPFRELLQSSFDLAVSRDLDLLLYIGYLGNAEQAAIIMEMIKAYRSHIKIIITDPVCGDHGRMYVPEAVASQWPQIINMSDMVFPNLTELKILTGNKPDADESADCYQAQFKRLYPETELVITSIKDNRGGIGFEYHGKEFFSYSHELLPQNYGGSGDAFLALFILNHFYKKLSINSALKLAADQTYQIIKHSIDENSEDLLLEIPLLNCKD